MSSVGRCTSRSTIESQEADAPSRAARARTEKWRGSWLARSSRAARRVVPKESEKVTTVNCTVYTNSSSGDWWERDADVRQSDDAGVWSMVEHGV